MHSHGRSGMPDKEKNICLLGLTCKKQIHNATTFHTFPHKTAGSLEAAEKWFREAGKATESSTCSAAFGRNACVWCDQTKRIPCQTLNSMKTNANSTTSNTSQANQISNVRWIGASVGTRSQPPRDFFYSELMSAICDWSMHDSLTNDPEFDKDSDVEGSLFGSQDRFVRFRLCF